MIFLQEQLSRSLQQQNHILRQPSLLLSISIPIPISCRERFWLWSTHVESDGVRGHLLDNLFRLAHDQLHSLVPAGGFELALLSDEL